MIDLASIEIPIGAKSIEKGQLQSIFCLDYQDSKKISQSKRLMILSDKSILLPWQMDFSLVQKQEGELP